MSDSISNFLTVIRNSSRSRKDTCLAKHSKMHLSIAKILKNEGFIRDFEETLDERGHKQLVLTLKYVDDVPAIAGIQRDSRPGCRLYYNKTNVPRVLGGLGMGIMTTSHGVMKDRDARRVGIGGEMVCRVW